MKDVVGITKYADVELWVPLGEFSAVNVDLDHFAVGHKLLVVEAGFLESKAGTYSDQEVALADDQIGGALTPGVEPTNVVISLGVAICPVPSGGDRKCAFRQFVSVFPGYSSADSRAEEECGTLREIEFFDNQFDGVSLDDRVCGDCNDRFV